ncbi:MAG TPA: DNA polymerase III subunit delta [Chthonomonadales bacterium]|nr:DNA polymerase III subunit delta [Chthonomonadales bacterium]
MELTFVPTGAEALWAGGIKPVYLIFGEEDFLKDLALSQLTARVEQGGLADFDTERLHASSATAGAILAAAAQLPFAAERRLIIVKGLERWRDRSGQAEADRLAAGLGSLAAAPVCMVLLAAAQEEEGRRKGAISPKLDSAAGRIGALVRCRPLEKDALMEWIRSTAAEAGKSIGPAAARLLSESVSGGLRALQAEMIKLACYTGERREILPADVHEVVAATPENVIFAAIDAIARRDGSRAFELLAELQRFETNEYALAAKLLSLLARQYRFVWQAKFLAEANVYSLKDLPERLAAELPAESAITQAAYRARDYFGQARLYTWPALERAMELLLLCDLANKGAVTDEAGVFGADVPGNLRILVAELTLRGRAGRAA